MKNQSLKSLFDTYKLDKTTILLKEGELKTIKGGCDYSGGGDNYACGNKVTVNNGCINKGCK